MRTLVRSLAVVSLWTMLAPSAAAAMTAGEYASITLDANVLVGATPDMINASLSCSFNEPLSRAAMRTAIMAKQRDLQTIIGTAGTVRKIGTASIYDHYNTLGEIDGMFTGSVNYVIHNVKPEATASLDQKLDDSGCSTTWDARVFRFGHLIREHKTELMEQIEEKKSVFEDMLGLKLEKVTGMNVYGVIDTGSNYSYYGNPYDPLSNTVLFLLTLSITYDFGTGEKK
ncbi:hypothetical protein FJZ28_03255 [Candidatus Peregrinibacteria bacterium]|nr:hypothetical protein [Candidatus Peregrinibacteria bacterium]